MIDLFHTRRTKFEKVLYFNEAPNRDLEVWVLNNKPTGVIYCQPVQNRNTQNNPVNNVVMYDKDSAVLLTSDHCEDIDVKSIILFRGHVWMVSEVSKELHLKESQFSNKEHFDTYIYIRR